MFIRPYLEKPTHFCTKTGALLVRAGPVFAEEIYIDVADPDLFLKVRGDVMLRGCGAVQAFFRASGPYKQRLVATKGRVNMLDVYPNRIAYLHYTTKFLFGAYVPSMSKGSVEEEMPIPFDINDAAMRAAAKNRLLANWNMYAIMTSTSAARFRKASLARLRWLETGRWDDAGSV